MSSETTAVETTVASTTTPVAEAPKTKVAKKAPVTKTAKVAKTVKTAKTTKKVAKKVAKAAPAKAKVAKESSKPATSAVEYGIEKSHDLPWSDKKVAVLKALKSLKAFSAMDAASTKAIAEKAGVKNRDARHYCYHAKAGGLVNVAEVEGVAGYSFYLTAKGVKLDPSAEFKAQQAAKAAK